jgi:predicted dithiol-disulfide oxidoreductase (DUF899 family)
VNNLKALASAELPLIARKASQGPGLVLRNLWHGQRAATSLPRRHSHHAHVTTRRPGCSSLVDGLGGVVVHLNDRDVTLLCMSHAPLDKLIQRRRGWTVPYVSAHGDDFLFDYGYVFRREEMTGIVREEFDLGQLLREAPQWLRDY